MSYLHLLFLSCVSVLLVMLSFSTMPFQWVTWFAWAPLFVVIDKLTNRTLRVLVFGFSVLVIWCWAVWWLVPAALQFTGGNSVLVILIWLLVCCALSLPYFLIGFLWDKFAAQTMCYELVLKAAMYTVFVSWFSWLLPGNIAHTQYVYPYVIQIVGVGGVPMLLFFIVMNNLAWANIFQGRSFKTNMLLVVLVPVCVCSYGLINIKYQDQPASSVMLGAIQPNFKRSDSLEPLFQQTHSLLNKKEVDLLVWPELPPSFSWQESQRDRASVQKIVDAHNVDVLLMSSYVYADDRKEFYYNAAQLIDEKNTLIGSYHKQTLVPFFEYIPFVSQGSKVYEWLPGALKYIAGPEKKPLTLTDDVRIAALICYEIIFPDRARHLVEQGANILINPSNDGWFQGRRASMTHFALALFRTVEHNVPWLRVSNSGVSTAVSANGEILTPLTPFLDQASFTATLAIPQKRSLYSKYGDVFLYFLTLLCFVFLLVKRVRSE